MFVELWKLSRSLSNIFHWEFSRLPHYRIIFWISCTLTDLMDHIFLSHCPNDTISVDGDERCWLGKPYEEQWSEFRFFTFWESVPETFVNLFTSHEKMAIILGCDFK